MYQKYGKRLLDMVLSGLAIVGLSPVFLLLAIAIVVDDPGPVFFRQTRVGHILRETSLDELPQIFQIFTGKMSIVGPRPALWNQDDLIRERDRYKANDVRPGLTGWAQINGRDELSIPIKAWYDGEYVNKLSFAFDCKCFLATFRLVLRHDGVVEGGTGRLEKEARTDETHSDHR